MLDFFRRYQQYFFVVITVVIVISFSFFGTNPNSSPVRPSAEIKALSAIDGSFVSRADLDDMVLFISTDALDKQIFGGQWGLNFLNDGVIRSDFLDSGLIRQVLEKHWGEVESDFLARMQKESKYQPYIHPAAGQAISAESAWKNFAPDLAEAYIDYKKEGAVVSLEGAIKKTKLFVEERKFPQIMLKRVLSFQQQQAQWAGNDPAIMREDFSLFGYHTLDDWFGPKLTHLISQVIWNGAIQAKKLGYVVSDEEATNDLLANAETTFMQMKGLDGFYFNDPNELFQEQLRRMQMDAPRAIAIWKKVLLYRKMMSDAATAVLIDPFMYKQFASYAGESVEVELYRIPNQLRINSFADLQHLEFYLDAVAKGNYSGLELPKKYLSVSDVNKNAPDLVQKNYTIQLKSVNRDHLATQVTLKQMWDWQVSDLGWKKLIEKFAALKVGSALTPEGRIGALDTLDANIRKEVDTFSRDTMVSLNPEWIDQALADQNSSEISLALRLKGGNFPIAGITNRAAIEKLLDMAPVNEKFDALSRYSQDDKNYHSIIVKIREDQPRILSFAEAKKDGTLELLTREKLEAFYAEIRSANKDFYQEKGEWKPLAMVRDKVAEEYFTKILAKIQDSFPEVKGKTPFSVAGYRLHMHVESEKQALMRNRDLYKIEQAPLAAQWNLEIVNEIFSRSKSANGEIDQALALEPGVWSPTKHDLKQGTYFYQTIKRIPWTHSVLEKIEGGQHQLGAEAQGRVLEKMITEWSAKGSITLDYLKPIER
jgi:GcvH upstream region-like protein